MSPQGWTDFCDRIDAALTPLDKIKTMSRIAFVTFFAGFVIFMIAPFTWLATENSSDPYGSESGFGFSFFAFIIGPLILMLGLVVTQCYASQKAKSAMNDVREVCDEISRQHSSLSFHVRFQCYLYRRYNRYGGGNHHDSADSYATNYIEVSIASVEAGGAAVAASAHPAASAYRAPSAPMVTASAVLADGGKSAADRLAELDKMKGMLTDTEYSERRKQILDSV